MISWSMDLGIGIIISYYLFNQKKIFMSKCNNKKRNNVNDYPELWKNKL